MKVFLTFPLAAALEPQCEGGGVEVVEIHCNIGFIGKLKVFIGFDWIFIGNYWKYWKVEGFLNFSTGCIEVRKKINEVLNTLDDTDDSLMF